MLTGHNHDDAVEGGWTVSEKRGSEVSPDRQILTVIFRYILVSPFLGSLYSSISVSRETKFEIDVGDIVVESISPSRHSAANFPFNTAASFLDEIEDINQESTNLQQDLVSSSRLSIGSAQRREENQLILAPLFRDGEDLDAASVIALRGSSRLIRITTTGRPPPYERNADSTNPETYIVKIYDSLMLRVSEGFCWMMLIIVSTGQREIIQLLGFCHWGTRAFGWTLREASRIRYSRVTVPFFFFVVFQFFPLLLFQGKPTTGDPDTKNNWWYLYFHFSSSTTPVNKRSYCSDEPEAPTSKDEPVEGKKSSSEEESYRNSEAYNLKR